MRIFGLAIAHAELEGTVGFGGSYRICHRYCCAHFILFEGGPLKFGRLIVMIVAISFFVFGGRSGEEGSEIVHGHLVSFSLLDEGVDFGLRASVIDLFVHRNGNQIKYFCIKN